MDEDFIMYGLRELQGMPGTDALVKAVEDNPGRFNAATLTSRMCTLARRQESGHVWPNHQGTWLKIVTEAVQGGHIVREQADGMRTTSRKLYPCPRLTLAVTCPCPR